MRVTDLVKDWWECVCDIEETESSKRQQELDAYKSLIQELSGDDVRVFIVSDVECVVSFWNSFDYYLQICSLEK